MRAFESAVAVPDADIDALISGAARVARVIADGNAEKPEEYASCVLGRIAWSSQRAFITQPQTTSLLDAEVHRLESDTERSLAILAGIEIRQLLNSIDARDRTIVTMRSRGFKYEEIARALGMRVMSVRSRYCIAKSQLRIATINRR
ncbi:MAG: hypothetical protein M3Y57_17810 [Acidobacteriota bacterium]|nr:hypothetical protein [Acidobacteriota bacterium]